MRDVNLHYTLLLLIHKKEYIYVIWNENLHYTLLLLILEIQMFNNAGGYTFTLHFATINTTSCSAPQPLQV